MIFHLSGQKKQNMNSIVIPSADVLKQDIFWNSDTLSDEFKDKLHLKLHYVHLLRKTLATYL